MKSAVATNARIFTSVLVVQIISWKIAREVSSKKLSDSLINHLFLTSRVDRIITNQLKKNIEFESSISIT